MGRCPDEWRAINLARSAFNFLRTRARKELQQYMPVGATALVDRTAFANVTDYYA
jgi:hypothetical protein